MFSERHRFLPGAHLCSVNMFENSASERVASIRECSKSADLHYGERKQHHRVCSFHLMAQALFLLLSIFPMPLRTVIYQYHSLKCLLWETSTRDHRWEEERHVQYQHKQMDVGMDSLLEGLCPGNRDMRCGL